MHLNFFIDMHHLFKITKYGTHYNIPFEMKITGDGAMGNNEYALLLYVMLLCCINVFNIKLFPSIIYSIFSRMSRQGKGPTPATPAVPGAVAQQAQQYLEQNIMAWMQPKPQGQVREQHISQ